MERWWNDFVETRHFFSLSVAEKDYASFIISGFTDYMYSYEGQEPGKWSLAAMESVCTNIFPEKNRGAKRIAKTRALRGIIEGFRALF